MTKAQLTRQAKFSPPFKAPSRQNVVCELIFAGKTRQEMKKALPALLLKRNLGVSDSVESLITTSITGLTKYKNWSVVRQPEGNYLVSPPAPPKPVKPRAKRKATPKKVTPPTVALSE